MVAAGSPLGLRGCGLVRVEICCGCSPEFRDEVRETIGVEEAHDAGGEAVIALSQPTWRHKFLPVAQGFDS
jgi:hypothetical protein